MARNFAQIVFLLYGFALLLVSRKHIFSVLERKMGVGAPVKKAMRGANAYLFLTVKDALPPALFWLNLTGFSLVVILAFLHLTVGWFAFSALFLKILNSLMLLATGALSWLLSILGNLMQFGTPFFLYRPDPSPKTDRAFASSVLDGIVYGVLPICMVISNFFAL